MYTVSLSRIFRQRTARNSMPFTEIPKSHDSKRETQNEIEIRDSFVDRIVADSDFTNLITINFARDIRNEPQRKQHNFQSQLAIQIQSICLNLTTKQVKKLPVHRVMKYCATPEDFKKTTNCTTPRHFNIAVAMPALSNKMNQFRVHAAANKLAQSIFKTKTTNCHIEEMPKQQENRKCRVRYDYKNCFRFDSFTDMKTSQDFISRRRKKKIFSSALIMT